MNTIASIVVGIDFTPSSAVALKEALRIAQWNLAAVRAVHVIDTLVAIELEDAVSEFQRDVRNGLMAQPMFRSTFALIIAFVGSLRLQRMLLLIFLWLEHLEFVCHKLVSVPLLRRAFGTRL